MPTFLSHLQSLIGDDYHLEREIARGGMAVVYLATDRRHGRRVALKVLDASVVGGLGAERFLREVEVAARLSHPHIVPLYDSRIAGNGRDEEPGILFYVMPYVAGETLRERIEKGGALPLPEAVRILREAASALDYAHREGVVHRDIKPENVLLHEGHAVIADFGVARAIAEAQHGGALTQTGMIVGTPAYMSAEQAGGAALLDGRSDQYSLACVLYELLSGRPPFVSTNPMGLLAQHVAAAPPPLHAPGPLPAGVEAAIHRALAKDPAERFATVGEFADAVSASVTMPSAVVTRLPGSAPALRGSRLPVPLTPLVGREQDVRALLGLVQRDGLRLLTLHGPGGVGKTRLALEVAARAGDLFSHGVHFVPLAEVTDVEALYTRLAQSAGLRGGAAGSRDALRDQLADRHALIVLDNFEQLVEHSAEIAWLLAECPSLKAFVTSQVLLHVYGEHEYPVPPLPLPDPHRATDAAALLGSPAVRLFVDRAVAARPDFTLHDGNSAAVVEICHVLDGVPLAIELAAARVKVTPPAMLLPKLRETLDMLTGGARDLPLRQRTMRGAVAWSHDLLAPDEQVVFRRLAVFAGGWTSAAGAAVCGAGLSGPAAHDAMSSLADHSLVLQGVADGEDARYRMLRPIHAFAAEALAAAGEQEAVVLRHGEYFMQRALESEAHVQRGDEAWLDRLEADHENLLAALDGYVRRAAVPEALRMSIALWRFWEARSYAREGLERMRDALGRATAETPPRLRLSATYAAGVLADACSDYALARELFERYLALAQEIGDPNATSVARNNLAVLLLRQGDYAAAIPLFEEAVIACREVGDHRAAAIGMANIGNAHRLQRDFAAARGCYGEALACFMKVGDGVNAAWTLSHLGDLARDEGDRETARLRYREALAAFTKLRHKRGMGAVLVDMADVLSGDERPVEARTHLEEALTHLADAGDQRGMIRVFESVAALDASTGASARAVRLAGAIAGLRDRLGAPLSAAERERLECRVISAVEALGVDESDRAWRAGLTMSMADVLHLLGTPGAV